MFKPAIALHLLGLAVVAVVPWSAGCSGGLSSEDARANCEEIRAARNGSSCMSDAAFDQCLLCYEDCGDACGVADTACPLTFNCPE